jgi:hypothetical protein
MPAVHPVPFGATWEWSTVDPDIIYHLRSNQIAKYNKATGISTNLDGPSTGEPVGYMAVVVGRDDWVCSSAGPVSELSRSKIFCLNPVNPSISKLIDVHNKTINGVPQSDPNWPTSAAGEVISVHNIAGGTGPLWLEVTFHKHSWGGNGGAVFNLVTNKWSLITRADFYWSGHVSMGNGKYANASGSIDGRDSRGMVLRNPDNLMNSAEYRFIYQPANTSNGWCDADHSSWLNSLTNPNAPILISRYGENPSCYQYAWTGEINVAAVDGSNTVWRFAHNYNAGLACYYGQAFAQISNDGKWALFSSPWGGTLGADTAFGCSSRIDTFIVDLMSATSSSSSGSSGGSNSSGSNTGSSGSTSGNSTTTTVRVQQNGAGVAYVGYGWGANANGVHSAGSASLTMEKGSRATLTFNGTGVTWIGFRDQWSGIANVYIDGDRKAAVDTYASPQKAQVENFSISGLSSGTHTITVEAAGARSPSSAGSWIWIDAFDVVTTTAPTNSNTGTSGGGSTGSGSTGSGSTGSGSTGSGSTGGGSTGGGSTTSPPVIPPTRVQQNGSGVSYLGYGWGANNNAVHSGGSASLTMDKGSRVTLSFSGTGVTWIGFRDQWSGIANVYIDGDRKATVDTYASPQKAQVENFSISGLSSGTHTITVEAAGARSPSSAGSWIWIDAFDVITGATSGNSTSSSSGTGSTNTPTTTTPPATTPPVSTSPPASTPTVPTPASPATFTTTRIQQNVAGIAYFGYGWGANLDPAHSGGSASLTNEKGSRVTSTFNGTGIVWIGLRDAWSGIANVYIDGVLKATVDTYASPRQAQAENFSLSGLSPGVHTITIEATGTKSASSSGRWIWIDAFDVTSPK